MTGNKESVARIGVSLQPKLLEGFDRMMNRMGYVNRSEAVRDAVRHYMMKNELSSDKGHQRIGVISVLYDHDVHGVSGVLTDLQHRYHSVIQSSIHLHLDEHNCMELVIVKGDSKKIDEIKDRLTTVSGVRHTDLMLSALTGY